MSFSPLSERTTGTLITAAIWNSDLVTNLNYIGPRATPAGVISAYAGATAPTGWLVCAGQEVSRENYADLFAVIGTTYGVGNEETTFNLPDLRGRVMAGMDNMNSASANRVTDAQADTRGGVLGAEKHALTGAENGPHTHTGPAHTHTQRVLNESWTAPGSNDRYVTGAERAGGGSALNTSGPGAQTGSSGTGNTGSSGSGTPHNNMQPTMFLNFIIKI